jgi:hypothetical protein
MLLRRFFGAGFLFAGLLLCACLVTALLVAQPGHAAGTKQGPVAAYSFDEGTGSTVADTTGDGHTATIEGAKWARGRYGDGLEFKGSEHNVVKIPASSELNFEEEFTLEAWVRPASSTDKLAPIVGKTTGGGSGSKSLSYYLYAGNSESKPYGEVQHVLGTGKKATASSAPPGATWTHLALTYDGAVERLYVNGIQVAETAAEAPVTTTGELQIGAETEHGEWFSGRIDEVRIYNRALNGAEVAADMEAPIQTPKQGPVAAYSFDEGTGSTVADTTGDGHTATIEDGEWTKGRYGGGIGFVGTPGNKCVSVPDSPELRFSEEFTLEAWIRPEGGSYEDPVVVRESSGKTAFGLGLGSREEYEAEGFIGEGKGSKAAVGGEKIREYEWVHVAATWDGSTIRLYVDGELADTETATSPPATGEGSLKMGCDGPDGQFTGQIDEVRVYNRALNGAEVGSDMEAPIQTPKQGPVAAYSFDEGTGSTVTDTTGDGHTATIEGAKWTSHGRYGGAMEFDAAEEDVLKIPASPELDFNEEFTLEAWVRPSGADNHSAPLIDKQEGGGHGYFLYEGGSVSDRPYGAANEEQEFVHAEEPLPADAWSHVALTFTGNRTYLYVDGELVDNGAAEPTITSEGELELGGSTDTADYFDGRIDEVRVYNRGLDAAEVAADMEAPIQTPKQGPVAAYSFDEGTGSTVEDVTGDGHIATIHGAEWTTRGKYGGAIELNAAKENYLAVPDSPELDFTEDFTLEAWVRPAGGNGHFAPVVAKTTPGTSARPYFLYEGGSTSNTPYGGINGGTATEAHSVAEQALPENVWAHLALIYDGSRTRLYVNGEVVDESPAPLVSPSNGELLIGGNSSGHFLSGRIDELRIYNRALTVGELNVVPESHLPSCDARTSEARGNALAHTELLPGGGYSMNYQLANGETIERPVPPEGFDPLTATAKELETYGLPPRPSNPEALEEWEESMTGYESVTPEPTGLCETSMETGEEVGAPEETGGPNQSQAWSGFVAVDHAHPRRFRVVRGTFVQPSASFDAGCHEPKEVSWVGLGGWNSSHGLMQDGTGIGPNENDVYAWYEYLNEGKKGSINITRISELEGFITQEAVVTTSVSFSKGAGQEIATFYISEKHGGQSRGRPVVIKRFDGEEFYNGGTAEWIDERPSINKAPTPLREFFTIPWSGMWAVEGDGDEVKPVVLPRERITMKKGPEGKVLAEPSALGPKGNGFIDTWHHCSP